MALTRWGSASLECLLFLAPPRATSASSASSAVAGSALSPQKLGDGNARGRDDVGSDQVGFKFQSLMRLPLIVEHPRALERAGFGESLALRVVSFTGPAQMLTEPRADAPLTDVDHNLPGLAANPIQASTRWRTGVGERDPCRPRMSAPTLPLW